MILLRSSERVARSWQNGGGTTSDVAVYPAGAGMGDFLWRVSIATIVSDSVFSSFSGVDRILVPLSSGGLTLRDEEGRHPIRQFESFGFDGERTIEAVDVDHRSLDLNLMTRRGLADGALTTRWVDGRQDFDGSADHAQLFIVLEGRLATEEGTHLGHLDAVLLDSGAARFYGHALVAVLSLSVRDGDG